MDSGAAGDAVYLIQQLQLNTEKLLENVGDKHEPQIVLLCGMTIGQKPVCNCTCEVRGGENQHFKPGHLEALHLACHGSQQCQGMFHGEILKQ